jgi:peptide/nickel transport system permease protein
MTDPQSSIVNCPLSIGRSLWADARRRLFRDRWAMLCLAAIFLYALVAVGGSLYDALAPKLHCPTFEEMKDYQHTNEPPTLGSWETLTRRPWTSILGTDWAGRPVLIKTILGAKVSMAVGLMSNIIAVPMGMLLGAIAGYYSGRFFRGGLFDDLIVWLYSTLSSVPGIILLIAIKFAFKGRTFLGLDLGGIHGLYLALGATSWIGTCRLIRAEVMKIRELDYVVAARASGRGSLAILTRHAMPNVMHIGIINFSLGFVGAVQAEVILSYLGLGVAVGTPSWGTMINSARTDLFAGKWWELSAAVTAMFVLVLALNIFGDRLRDALDPKLKNV